MVRNLGVFWFLSLWILSANVWAEVKVYPKSVQLGEPITVVFLGKNIEQDFAKIDKESIRSLFEIYDVDGNADRVRLTLYPLETGTLKLPIMQQGQIDFKGLDIEVRKNADVTLNWQKPNLTQQGLAVFEPYLWRVSVKAPTVYSVLLEAHPHQTAGSQSLFQPESVDLVTGLFSDERHFMLAYWAEQPAAQLALRSPVIRVKNSSQKTWLFFDKTQPVQVKPLPNYLPLRIPVGTLKLAQKPLPFWLEVGQLNVWSLQLLAQNVTADRLPNLAQAMEQSSKDLEWLTPSSSSTVAWSQLGWQTQQDWQLPLRLNRMGWVNIPAVRLTYFDVTSGQLQDVWLPSSIHWALPSWVLMIFEWFTWLSFMVLGGVLLLILKGFAQKWRALRAVAKAQTIEQVWLALRQYGLAKVWTSDSVLKPEALTLEAALLALNNAKVPHETLALLNALNQHFYSADNALSLQAAQQLAQAWLKRLSVFQRLSNELRTMRYFLKATPKA